MNTAAQIMGLDKLCGLYNVIKCNGGLTKLMRQLYRANDLKCGELIEEALNSTCCKSYPDSSRYVKDSPEDKRSFDPMMSARLLRWLNHLTKDCFLLIPAKRLTSCDEDLQLSKLDLSLSAPQLTPPLNIWDCFSIVFPPQTIEMTELFASESLDGESMHYYLAITKNNMEGSAVSDDIASHLSKGSIISNEQFSSTMSDDIYNSNSRVSLRKHLTNRNVSRQKPKICTESCTMKPCTTKSKTGILSGTGENLGSLKKRHIDCNSELEIECNESSKDIRRRFGSKEGEITTKTDVDKREEKEKKLHMESKIAADISNAMELLGEENKNDLIGQLEKQPVHNNMIVESKEIAANKKVTSCSSQEIDTLTKNPKVISSISQETDTLTKNPKEIAENKKVISCSSQEMGTLTKNPKEIAANKKVISCSSQEMGTLIKNPKEIALNKKVISYSSQEMDTSTKNLKEISANKKVISYSSQEMGTLTKNPKEITANKKAIRFSSQEMNTLTKNSKQIAADKKAIRSNGQVVGKLTKNAMLCSDAGKHPSGTDCKSKNGQPKSCKPDEGCGDKKPGCGGKKPEGTCGGGEKPKKGGCGGESKKDDEGTCHPNLHRKHHPCEKPGQVEHNEDPKDAQRKAKSKEHFNKKLKSIRNKYKIDHCRKSKVIWGRSDFNKKARNKTCDVCNNLLNEPTDVCSEN